MTGRSRAVALDPFSYWDRMFASWRMMAATGDRVVQTAQASGAVIASRGETMRAAVSAPWSGDYAELSRMVPEKVAAFSSSGLVMMQAWVDAQAAWWDQAQSLSAMMLRGRPATPVELMAFGSTAAASGLKAMEAAARTGRDTLAPIHKAATGNARRLGRKG
ncbi:hypothetical protein ASG11_03645 [Sphingomonas sp. Leaf357]|uniref:hypothetical protein n=1 Tax=Sphingomonas sp. Leaf357 TaxID=1736350 RepID=UPI0006F38FCD|nr:hypothetical protein [Sphingomonas sp. Leaf357]KQS03467.1 hypothetical protein ASG11_03645 [Sphingomonas sp. Leaf357]